MSGPKRPGATPGKVVRSLTRRVRELRTDAHDMARASQAAYRSVEDGQSVTYYDEDGTPRHVTGQQDDGSYSTSDVNGPPLEAPSDPIVEVQPGALVITWDGFDALDQAGWPSTFHYVAAHVSTEQGFVPDGDTETHVYPSSDGGTFTYALPLDTVFYVVLVAVNTSGVWSVPSAEVAAVPAGYPSDPASAEAERLAAEAVAAAEAAAAIAAAAESGTESVTRNGSFEAGPRAWSVQTASRYIATNPYRGTKAFDVSTGGTQEHDDRQRVTTGQTWRYSYAYRASADYAGDYGPRPRRFDGTGTSLGLIPGYTFAAVKASGGGWVEASFDYLVPAGVDKIDVGRFAGSVTAGQVAIDAVRLVNVTEVLAAQAAAQAADDKAKAAQETANKAVQKIVTQYAVNTSETVPPGVNAESWSTATPTRNPGTFVWIRSIITNADGSTTTTAPALLTGNTGSQGNPGGPGDTGPPGVSVVSVTPYYALVTAGSAVPVQPTNQETPPAPWVPTEPGYVPNRELYRTERVAYSNGVFAYTARSLVSAYTAAADAKAAAEALEFGQRNRVVNGSAENNLSGWAVLSAGISAVTAKARTGVKSFLTTGSGEIVGAAVAVAPGDSWRYSGWYQTSSGYVTGAPGGLRLQGSANGSTWADVSGGALNLTGNRTVWTEAQIDYTVPASGILYLRPRLAFAYSGGHSAWLEDLELVNTTVFSDGVPPAATPTPTVRGGYRSVAVVIPAVANNDPVTVDLWAAYGATPSVTGAPLASVQVSSVAPAVQFIREVGGRPIVPTDVVHVIARARDYDGPGPLSGVGIGSPALLETTDAGPDFITADMLVVNQAFVEALTASDLSATTISGLSLNIGGILLNPSTGLTIPDVANLAATGSWIRAALTARSLTLENFLKIQGKDNEISQGASVTLAAGVSAPRQAPQVESYWQKIAVMGPNDGASLGFSWCGWDMRSNGDMVSAYWSERDGSYLLRTNYNTGAYKRVFVNNLSGYQLVSYAGLKIGAVINPANGEIVTGGWGGSGGGQCFVLKIDADMTTVTKLADYNVGYRREPRLVRIPRVGMDNYYGILGLEMDNVIRLRTYLWTTGAAGPIAYTYDPGALRPNVTGYANNYVPGYADGGNDTRHIVFTPTEPRQYSNGGGERTDKPFSTAYGGTTVGAAIGAGTDPTGYERSEYVHSMDDTGNVWRYCDTQITGEAAYSFLDSDPLGTGTHETVLGPRAPLAIARGAGMKVTPAPPPDTGDPDAPNFSAIYSRPTTTGTGAFSLLGNVDGVASSWRWSYRHGSGGTFPQSPNTFASANLVPGAIESTARDNDASMPAYVTVRGDGTFRFADLRGGPSGALLRGSAIGPVGGMMFYPGAVDPLPAALVGWLLCNGATFSSSTYPALAAVLGGTTLPDLRDRAPFGVSSAKPLGTVGGAAAVTLTANQLPAHSHTIRRGGGTGTNANTVAQGNAATATNPETLETGGGVAVDIQNRYYAGHWIIRAL